MSYRTKRLSADIEAFWCVEHDEHGKRKHLDYKIRVTGRRAIQSQVGEGMIHVMMNFDAWLVDKLAKAHIGEIFKDESDLESVLIRDVEVVCPAQGLAVRANARSVLPRRRT